LEVLGFAEELKDDVMQKLHHLKYDDESCWWSPLSEFEWVLASVSSVEEMNRKSETGEFAVVKKAKEEGKPKEKAKGKEKVAKKKMEKDKAAERAKKSKESKEKADSTLDLDAAIQQGVNQQHQYMTNSTTNTTKPASKVGTKRKAMLTEGYGDSFPALQAHATQNKKEAKAEAKAAAIEAKIQASKLAAYESQQLSGVSPLSIKFTSVLNAEAGRLKAMQQAVKKDKTASGTKKPQENFPIFEVLKGKSFSQADKAKGKKLKSSPKEAKKGVFMKISPSTSTVKVLVSPKKQTHGGSTTPKATLNPKPGTPKSADKGQKRPLDSSSPLPGGWKTSVKKAKRLPGM